jgi:PAS domain S-box-containing protein
MQSAYVSKIERWIQVPKILIVDDDALLREWLAGQLVSRGHHTFEAANGGEALEIARQQALDLVLSDVLMPVMDGFELLRQLRLDPATASIPVILISGAYDDDAARALALAGRAVSLVRKPFRLEEIMEPIDAALTPGPHPLETVPAPAEFGRDHMRLLMGKLSEKVAELEQAGERMRKSESLLAEAQALAHIGSWEWDVPTDRVIWSDQNYRNMGLEPQEVPVTYAFFLNGVHPDDRARIDEAVQQAFRDHQPVSHDYRVILPNGKVRIQHSEGTVFTDKSGRVVRMFGTTQDITERKLSEDALRQSEGRFHSIVDEAIVGIVQVDLSGRLLSVNDCYCKMLGYGRGELLQLRMQDVTHPDDLPGNEAQFQALVGGGPNFQIEKRYCCKDGSIIWVINRVNGIRDAGGAVQSVVAVSLEVTERKRAEQALRDSEHRYRNLVEGLQSAVYLCDAEGRITLYNAAAAALWGRKPEIGKDLWCGSWRLYHADGSPLAHEDCPMSIAIREGRSVRLPEIVVERPDGIRSYVLAHPDPIRDASGALVGAVNMLIDLTERKLAEESLRESEERFRQVAENIGKVFWLTDPGGNRMHYVSPAYEKIWGHSCDSLYAEPKSWMDAIHPGDRERIAKVALTAQGPYDHSYRIIRPDGSIRWIRDHGFPVHDKWGKFIRVAGFAEDITERKVAEREIQSLGESYQALSHRLLEVHEEERRHLARELHDEVGQTLTAAKLSLKTVAPEVPPAVASRFDISIQLLDHLLRQVRRLSLDLCPPMLDDLGLVPALRWLVDQQAQRTALRITFTANVERLEMESKFRTACFRVAQEALTNAIRHARAAKVAVDLRAEPDRVWLVVDDDGMGFDHGAKHKSAARGASFGLLSMNERISLLGGELVVGSVPGRGTKIRAWLPLAPAALALTM